MSIKIDNNNLEIIKWLLSAFGASFVVIMGLFIFLLKKIFSYHEKQHSDTRSEIKSKYEETQKDVGLLRKSNEREHDRIFVGLDKKVDKE